MSNNLLVRIILLPLSLLYGAGVALRNLLYRYGILKSVRFNIPVISVGNLSVGGTGKTPHTAYLLRLLSSHIRVASLSRGYGRKSRGFKKVTLQNSPADVGDEPLLLKFKFPSLDIYVSEDRATGIPKLLSDQPEIRTVLLDDAFQHRAVVPYINILLTTYDHPFTSDWLMPSGRLREWRQSYTRSDIMIVTKCPENLNQDERQAVVDTLKPGNRPIFFTRYVYGSPYYFFDSKYRLDLNQDTEVILLTAIAGTDYLIEYLQDHVGVIHNRAFRDHHDFTDRDIGQLELMYSELKAEKKAIICTEKDAVRLIKHRHYLAEKKLPIFVLPIDVHFLFGEAEAFHQTVTNRLLEFKA